MTQHRHRNRVSQVERFGQGRFDEGPCLGSSGFTTYCIEQPGNLVEPRRGLRPHFPGHRQGRPRSSPSCKRKGFDVKTHEDVRRFIEENLFAVWMQGVMDSACASNEPAEQRALVHAATVLNYARGADFIDWLYDGDGKMRVFVPNDYFRDGAPFESTGGYNARPRDLPGAGGGRHGAAAAAPAGSLPGQQVSVAGQEPPLPQHLRFLHGHGDDRPQPSRRSATAAVGRPTASCRRSPGTTPTRRPSSTPTGCSAIRSSPGRWSTRPAGSRRATFP